MATVKTIAIIGATGSMGAAIAKSLSKGNYHLLLMSRQSEQLAILKSEIEAAGALGEINTADCAHAAAWEADIIVVAAPYEAEREIADKIREVAVGKIVVSISNPLNSHYTDLVTSPNTSAAEELQKMLPYSKVVKTFNTTFAANFISPAINGTTADSFIAGNNSDALQVVADLVKSVGFNPVIAGDLSVSRTLERMQLLLIQLGVKNNYNWIAGWKVLHQ